MKRIFLFLLTNIAVLVVISVILSVFGLSGRTNNMGQLLAFSAVVGFTGSIISLLMSKWMAKRSTGAQVITQPVNEMEAWLVRTVERQAEMAGIKTPEVAIYYADEPNAFATGPSKNNSLVAVSSGLLNMMTRDEAEAVLAHEVSHVANGDMVTLTLIQGVVNTFVVFLSRLIANVISNAMSNDREGGLGPIAYMVVTIVLQIVFGMLASLVVMWFSRKREYRADEGAARLAGAPKMIAALKRLNGSSDESLPKEMMAMGIAGGGDSLFSTHPSIENRIANLSNYSGTAR
ncbi:MAG: protease HtpX [Neisseriaceae bacterium]|nr:protease HtpX [Neisseriaceae bacterium]